MRTTDGQSSEQSGPSPRSLFNLFGASASLRLAMSRSLVHCTLRGAPLPREITINGDGKIDERIDELCISQSAASHPMAARKLIAGRREMHRIDSKIQKRSVRP